jgi:hypothetical protein
VLSHPVAVAVDVGHDAAVQQTVEFLATCTLRSDARLLEGTAPHPEARAGHGRDPKRLCLGSEDVPIQLR